MARSVRPFLLGSLMRRRRSAHGAPGLLQIGAIDSKVDIAEIGRRMWYKRIAYVTRGWQQMGGRAQRVVDGNNRQLTRGGCELWRPQLQARLTQPRLWPKIPRSGLSASMFRRRLSSTFAGALRRRAGP